MIITVKISSKIGVNKFGKDDTNILLTYISHNDNKSKRIFVNCDKVFTSIVSGTPLECLENSLKIYESKLFIREILFLDTSDDFDVEDYLFGTHLTL